ncbi:MAG: trypsin-like peptidase domain-containing protein [Alphaproteobacteria bacterium]|nr:trypsin-like peptidase domain-containing protein [Alphaproteobacteria bacterium]
MSAKMKIFFSGFLAFGVLMTAQNVWAANNADGSIFSGGTCTNCRAKTARKVTIVDGTQKRTCPNCPTFKTKNYAFAEPRYKSPKRTCCDMASFALTNVDFKLNENANPYAQQVGNYRFRIFGCRRIAKKAMLDQGRIMQNYMGFRNVFGKAADKCYKVMEIPNVCLSNPGVQLPEYVLTAEINNLFMNVCDEYDWDKASQANKRDGSAEMTVTWRLMNLSQTKVFWKGVTTGYAEVTEGVYDGEIKLAEEAFADAAARLSSLPGFEAQLKQHVSADEQARERAALVAYDAKYNPGKCAVAQPAPVATPCGQPVCPLMMAQPVMMPQPICPCAVQQPCICTQPVCTCPQPVCPCAMPVKTEPKVEEFVDVKTKKKIIEQKIITKTRIETPAPVCQQVCQPVCPQPACQVQCTKTCQQPKCRKICTETCDESTGQCTNSCREDCSQPVQPKVEVVKYVPQIEEKSEVEVKNVKIEPQVEEKSGIVETHRVIENCIDENGNVVSDPSCEEWYDLIRIDNTLCVVDRDPYEELSPENMLKIRGSVVDITNALGKQGTGLLISDSFVLTSASLINKLQNTYTVKTINGNVLKAKAVRYNPNKNIALLHLDTPASYTPLSLSRQLPPVDQEGFIALGHQDGANAKSYLEDNGKIYGYRYSDLLGTEIIVDTLVSKVYPGSVLIDKLGTVSGVSNTAQQTDNGMDLFLPTDVALKSVGLSICERIYKPVTEQIKQETVAPEVMPAPKRK